MSAGPRLDEDLVREERGLLRGWWGSVRADGQKSHTGVLEDKTQSVRVSVGFLNFFGTM